MHGAPTDPPSLRRSTLGTGTTEVYRSEIIFYLNGSRQSAAGDALQLTLADWLRRDRRLVGTKVMCNEGDCGACSVLIGRPDATDSNRLQYRAVDACIALLFQLDRCHVVTVEGLTTPHISTRHVPHNELTAIQRAMVDCHGSQCGFCTPGFIMAMHAMVAANQPLNDDTMRYGLSGNLCRCTGYVQILAAGRRAAEEISDKSSQDSRLGDRFDEPAMIADFHSLGRLPIQTAGQYQTLIPQTIAQACQFRAAHRTATCVAGGTDYGVLRNHHRLSAGDVIYLGQIDLKHPTTQPIESSESSNGSPDNDQNAVQTDCGFQEIRIQAKSLTIGAGATWTAIERAVAGTVPEYHHLLTRFGSPQVRNMGTIGGNLASGSPIADAVPFHLVLDTVLELASIRGLRLVRLEDFYQGYRDTILEPDELIVRIHTRLPTKNERLRLFKVSKRRDMDISTVTFAMLANIADDTIVEAKVAVGGVGPQVMRIAPAEAFMRGKSWTLETLRAAGRIVRENVTPRTDVRGGADYRCQLAENLMVKSYYPAESSVDHLAVRSDNEE